MNATIQQPIDIATVMSVYSGRAGVCACGCAGKHTYASAFRDAGTERRGYPIADDEINDRTVKTIVGKVNRIVAEDPKALEQGDDCVFVETDSRLYIVRFAR